MRPRARQGANARPRFLRHRSATTVAAALAGADRAGTGADGPASAAGLWESDLRVGSLPGGAAAASARMRRGTIRVSRERNPSHYGGAGTQTVRLGAEMARDRRGCLAALETVGQFGPTKSIETAKRTCIIPSNYRHGAAGVAGREPGY